jgi:hypothetical protein
MSIKQCDGLILIHFAKAITLETIYIASLTLKPVDLLLKLLDRPLGELSAGLGLLRKEEEEQTLG